MKQLLSIEWIKLKKLSALHIITLIYIVMVPAWMFAMNLWFGQLNKAIPLFPNTKTLWSFPTVWRFVTYSASWFTFLYCIVVVIITTNEFTNRTMRQHIIDGLTKGKVIAAKFLVLLFLAVFVTLVVFLTGFFFGASQSESIDLYSNIHYVFLFFLQTLCYFGLAFFISILIKRPALSILIYMGIQFIEFIIGFFLPQWIYAYMPMNNIAKLTPLPFFDGLVKKMEEDKGESLIILETWQIMAVAGIAMLIFYLLAYSRLRRKDL